MSLPNAQKDYTPLLTQKVQNDRFHDLKLEMESSDGSNRSQSIRVAMNIRPMITSEVNCISGEPQIFNDEVSDLLESRSTRAPILIRETANEGISLAGVTEVEVSTTEEMAILLVRGSARCGTGSTNMNNQSSQSHAIFTISMLQKRIVGLTNGDDSVDDALCAKLYLVDLAGTERAARTGAEGMRFKEASVSPADTNTEETNRYTLNLPSSS
ncbi:hypothetical protein OSB04_003108 [Centaurea solstitialis]|uniref:Kinesin motor domain-containing protein n=1 Tax=Centaurea solstitialis TaxID=347529 RepID=A0AA38WNF2_9ASTR|nr:hypothetical protein OSB04_003108 [Centaurea solstitialis]